MRAAISIEHPAWAHQFKNIINKINTDGETLVLACDKDGDLRLLDAFGIKYKLMANSTGKNIIEKGFLFLKLCITYTHEIRKFNPDILIGRASPMMAIAAKILHKPHVIFEDTEVSKFSLNICKKCSSVIMTPQTFLTDLGEKQLRLPIYKELFYLHEKEFTPDIEVVKRCGINPDERYAIVRFVAWNASHDVGLSGLNDRQKIDFVRRLEKSIRVYVSNEGELPDELKGNELKIPYEDIHHVLYFASVVITEGATMANEAAVLGTYSFYLNAIALGYIKEQEERFGILRVLHDPVTRYEIALSETEKLLESDSFVKEANEKRKKLLEEMPDPNDIFWDKMQESIKKK